MDEIRISNVDRGTPWMLATYETGRDHFIDWGTAETSAVTKRRLLFGVGL